MDTEETKEQELPESTEEKTETAAALKSAYDGLLAISVFCGLIGMLLGPVPAALWVLAFGKAFFPLFIAAPAIMLLFCKLLKSGRDWRTLIVMAVFSLAGAYLTALTCQAAIYVRAYSMSIFNIPLVTMLSLGKAGVLPASESAYVFPLLFTAFGAAAAWELLSASKKEE